MLAWCLYDLANTIFAMNMTSYHFPVWVVVDQRGGELIYSLVFALSMLASAVLMPRLGRHSDRHGGRIVSLAGWTLGCVFFTGLIGGVGSLFPALALFAAANFCYQLAGIFYNALLPAVSSASNVGRISGYGVALGYVGTLIGILAVAPWVAKGGHQAAFLPTALLFLVLSIPSFFWVKEPAPRVVSSFQKREEVKNLLKPLLLPACLGLSVLGAAVLFMSVYAKQAIGLSDAELQNLLITATAVTVVGTFFWGHLTDRWGGYRSLGCVWVVWVAAFGLASVGFDPRLFWVVACLAGVAMGGTWVSSRVLLIKWAGPASVGEALGLFGLVSRIASVTGPLLWGGIVWSCAGLGREKYRVVVIVLLILTLCGAWSYQRLRGLRPDLIR